MHGEIPDYSPDPTLTPQQHRVLALIAEGNSLTAAATDLGIHRNTIRNWRRSHPAFAREMELAIREQALAWHEQAISLVPRAAQVLEELLHNPTTPDGLRMRAALAVLKTASDPQPKPLPLMNGFGSELEAARGERLARAAAPLQENANPCTTLHNAPIRRAPEPGRNSPCPCGSGQKFKRCCAFRAQISTTAAPPGPNQTAAAAS